MGKSDLGSSRSIEQTLGGSVHLTLARLDNLLLS